MKKYLIHIVYLLVIAFFVVFAYVKAKEAEKLEILAAANAQMAKKSAMEAQRQVELAVQQAARAKMEENRASALIKELENCKSSKK